MAFIEEISSSEGNSFIFNVTHAAGSGAPNFWTDIMLVQYFISNIYLLDQKKEFTRPLSGSEIVDLPDPNRDFKNLKKTEKWIKIFQQDMVKLNARTAVDGRVDRSRGLVSAITDTFYTIQSLNTLYKGVIFDFFNVEDPLEFALADPSMPALLKNQLFASEGRSN